MDETPECERVRPFLGELATDAATGYERADALRHVVDCPVCRRELTDLARVADELLLLTPPVDPPPGFEAAVVKRIVKLADRPRLGYRIRRRVVQIARRRMMDARLPSRPAVRLAAVSLALVLAASAGAAATYWQGAPDRRLADRYEHSIGAAGSQYPRAVPVMTATGSLVGHVFLYAGTPAWATVALTAAPQSGDYTMSVVTKAGKRYPEGVCTVTGRSGISGYPLPVPLDEVAAIDLSRPGIRLTVRP